MAKIILNPAYVPVEGDVKQLGKYLFDAGDGSPVVELKVWLETSKANDKHPDGKPWIILPKGNITNRNYFSETLFIETNKDGEVEVEVKTSAPRVLGATGVKQDIIKFLSEEEAAEYTELVTTATEAFKAAKVSGGKVKPEDMTAEQLEAYIAALRAGKSYQVSGPKTFIDLFTAEQYERYNELLALAASNKANAPKAARRKLTDEEKALRSQKRKASEIEKAEALLAQLQARM